MPFIGTFATDVFEDVGHSTDAREMMEQYCIGVMADDDKEKKCKVCFPYLFSIYNI